jgi:uncharacterized protein
MSRRVPPRGFFEGESPFGRLPTEPGFPTIRIPPSAVLWIILAAAIVLLVILLQPFATFYTDWLWFRGLGYGNVFGTRFLAQIITFFVFAAIFWVVGTADVLVALGGSGRRLSTIGIRRRLLTTPATTLSLLGVFLLGLIFGRIASGQWQTVLAFLRQVPFGTSDPVWHQDVSFYVFTLPFYRFVWGWLLGVVIVLALVAVVLYVYRSGMQSLVLTTKAMRHLTVLAAAFTALLAVNYRLDLYELLLSRRGFVYGAGYTDVTARIPGYWIMTVLLALITVGLLINLGPARFAAVPTALAGWLAAAFVVLVLYPGFVQRIQVAPDELHKETPYIAREIAGTRQGFGLNSIVDRPFSPETAVTADAVARNPATVENARLWDPQLALPQTLENLQALRNYYDFSPIAVDRYVLDGKYLQLLLGARELNPSKLPANAQSWVNLKLQYTHGYGVAAVRANLATAQGNPVLTLQDIPPQGVPPVTQPAIYFGRNTSDYVLADSKTPEFDYPAEVNHYTHWTGTTGVPLTSGLRSLAFAVRFGDFNMLISNELTPQTQVLFRRTVQDRVQALAPFLQLDQDPYIVIADGKLYWIQDAYTTSDRYPYSEPSLTDPNLPEFVNQNYIRNSVKVVVDAYTGASTLYIADPADPIIRTYSAIFPGLFKPLDDMPASIRAHVRYPRDLFSVQAERFTQYHMQDPATFYQKEDLWAIAQETQQQLGRTAAMRPFYVIMRLPGESQAQFFTILPYTPNTRNNMIAYLVARSDPPEYGKLLDFRFPKDSLIVGPQQVESNIDQAPAIKSQFSLLNQSGSSIIRGNLLVLPIESSLLYIEPIYLQASNLPIPQLKKVIVATGQQVAMEDTLDKALASLLGNATAVPSGPGTPVSGPPSGTIATLIAQANQHYQAAQADLRQGNLAAYATEIQQVGAILAQLQVLQGSSGASASPSPRASPTASP